MQRIAAAGGLIAAVLFVLSIVVSGGDAPDFDAAPSEWAAYYAGNRDEIQMSALLLSLAVLELLLFAGYLRGELGRIELARRGFTRASHTVLAGAVLVAVGLVAGSALDAGVASLPEDTDPEIFRALGNASGAIWMVGVVGFVVMLSTTSLIALASRALPVWIAWIGFLGAAAWFALLFFVLDPTNEDSALGIAWPIGFLALIIWLVGLSITFLRRVGRPEESAAIQ